MGHPAIQDLKKPWQSRVRKDSQVTGAIELAFLRGEQAGREAAIEQAAYQAELRARVFGGEPTTTNEQLIVEHIVSAIRKLK